jgi:hypothetical protein
VRFLRFLSASALCGLLALGQSFVVPSVLVNIPHRPRGLFLLMKLEGYQYHRFNADLDGVTVEMKGLLLKGILETAAWSTIPENERSQYIVEVTGSIGDKASFTLAEADPGSFNKRFWLVLRRAPKPLPSKETPMLVVVNGDGMVTQTVPAVESIRVTAPPTPLI